MNADSMTCGSKFPQVNVLLSIHNPNTEWLETQILSICDQINVEVTFHIRNDGPNEVQTTLSGLLGKLEANNHLGVGASFMELLSKCDSGGFSFCDQDDIWAAHKLSSQIQALAGLNLPTMAYCDFQIIDSEARKMGARKSPKKISKFSFLFRNNIPGFSMYFNNEARNLLKNSKEFLPVHAYHDWWSAIAISQLGRCVRVPEELASYRIHDNNAIGISDSALSRLRNLVNRVGTGLNETEKILLQMIRFIEFHSPSHESINFLKQIANGMRMGRFKRLLILIRQGVLQSSMPDVANSVLLYVLPSKLKF